MKTLKSLFMSLLMAILFQSAGIAQSEPAMIAVINKADWCPVCQNNGPRAMAAFMANNTDGSVRFVVNDLTNDETIRKSAKELKLYGLDKVISEYKGTGVAYFFNPDTKQLISQVSVAKPDPDLADALQTAKKSL
jgi:hypothetical protein